MDRVHEVMEDFLMEYCDKLPKKIPLMLYPFNVREFFNDHGNAGIPFITRKVNLEREDPPFMAAKYWNSTDYLRRTMKDEIVTVSVTPVGRSHDIDDDMFMVPEDRKMPFSKFYDSILEAKSDLIYCLKKKSNNLLGDCSSIASGRFLDVPNHLEFATEAFDRRPESANLLVDNGRSPYPMRRDLYEKFMYVIDGIKIVDLYPPVATYWMPQKKYKKFQWYFGKWQWEKKDLKEEITWVTKDKRPETWEKVLLYTNTKTYRLVLEPGQFAYIPSMWYHEIQQPGYTVSVDYWYTMNYGSKMPYYRFYDKLCNLIQPRKDDASQDVQPEFREDLRIDLTNEYLKNLPGPSKK